MQWKSLLSFGLTFGMAMSVASAQEIAVGMQYPMSGPMASATHPYLREGAMIALQRINEQRLLGEGRTFKLILEDNSGDRAQAIALTNRFATTDNVIGVFGVYSSLLALPIAPVANDLKVPFVAVAASPEIGKSGPWSFTYLEQATSIVSPLIELADKLKLKKLVIVYDRSNDASVRTRDLVADLGKARNIGVALTEGVTPQETNFAPLATKIVGTPIDGLFIDLPPMVAANFLVQIRQAGLDPNVTVLTTGQVNAPTFYNIAGDAANGIYFTADYSNELNNAENKYLVDAYKKMTGNLPNQFVAWGYDGLLLFARAIREAGPTPDRQKVRDALANFKNIPTALGLGTMSFDENRLSTIINVLMHVEKGTPKLVK